MKIYINSSAEPYFNLATEEYLLEHTQGDIFLLWRSEPSVIIGKNQNAFAEVNLAFTRSHGIKVVRRLTGGGAVFHDLGNLNFTFITPYEADKSNSDGIDFARFTAPVIAALESLGVKAYLSGRNDILADSSGESRKISGNAQCRYSCADGSLKTMHHGTLLYSADFASMQGALNVDPEKLIGKGIRSVRSRVANIADLLETPPDITGFMRYLADHVANQLGERVEPLPESMRNGISELVKSKYSTDEWNLRRMASFELEVSRRFAFGRVSIGLRLERAEIASVHIEGDFIGELDIGGLESELIGCEYDRAALTARLSGVGRYICGATAAQIAELICE